MASRHEKGITAPSEPGKAGIGTLFLPDFSANGKSRHVHPESSFIPIGKEENKERFTGNAWEIRIDGYDPSMQKRSEVINSLSNGYMGFRASSVSVPQKKGIHQPGAYIAGFFEKTPHSSREDIEDVSNVAELVRVPVWTNVSIHNGLEQFDIDSSKLLSYKTTLDMKNGVLKYHIRWEDRANRVTTIAINQFLSQKEKHIGVVQFSFTPENYSDVITLGTGIDGRVDNKGKKLFREVEKGEIVGEGIYYAASTKYSGDVISIGARINVSSEEKPIKGLRKVTKEKNERITQEIALQAEKGSTYSLDKVVSIHSSHDEDGKDPILESQKVVFHPKDPNQLVAEHEDIWHRRWETADSKITGDEEAQLALRYNLFKLMQLGIQNNGRSSIAAKGLDNIPGEGYNGHVFWDTEIFMLPFFIHTEPEVAKSLLLYRYRRLDTARDKAKENGYEGALYPWESADTGGEETPKWVKDQNSGKLIRIYTGEREIHINSDIAWGVWEYYKATGDKKFLKKYGAEMIAETARFWVSKAMQDSDPQSEFYEIKGVISPDEFHEQDPNGREGIDNSFFNNAMAKWNIEKAVDIWDRFAKDDPQLQRRMGLDKNTNERWREVSKKINIPFLDEERNIYSEFDGFSKLKPIDLKRYPGIHAMDSVLRSKGEHPYVYQLVKQADVLEALLLLGETNPEVISQNYEYYAPRTSHGSSLSDASHAIAAARAGHMDRAYEHFQHSMLVDLSDKKKNNHVGSHAASMGATWRAAVYGFGGVTLGEDRLIINPKLPEKWKEHSFNVRYRGLLLKVTEDKNTLTIDAPQETYIKAINVEVNGKEYKINSGNRYTIQYKSEENNAMHSTSPREKVVFQV